ncbi:hypothetical protein INS49_000869 [Diaporthe citri]|uniref:uncharacterized protein n=1 Tax=Diaporthe citri TaxID=83186 RepID=UPI001C7FF2EA|nr:uncharacterized protein INS49_000869 [Diaporthe citri]KAG6366690.1 hypothetical protein INS49_000869 [Diaporthe citri]
MSSRFVSGGTTDTKTGEIVPADPATSTPAAPTTTGGGKRSEEWAAVQAQVEEDRRRRQQQREEAASRGGEEKSLYEVLQANKAAKQAQFEEANKLKNQFRALDDDEVEFLDGVRERRRAEEERLRRETEEGLKGFRELQSKVSAAGEGEGPEGEGAAEGGGWSVGRKRKRRKDEPEGVLKGLKRRSSAAAAEVAEDGKADEKGKNGAAGQVTSQEGPAATDKDAKDTQEPEAKPAAPATAKPKAALVDYGSDDDSD